MNSNWNDLFDGSIIDSPECISFCIENQNQVLASLPVAASELAGLCGFPILLGLINLYGGRKIYLPKSAVSFTLSMGIEIPEKEYQLWRRLANANGQMDIPSKWGIFLSLRRAAIYQSLKEGSDKEALVVNFGISQRQIRNLLNKYHYVN